MTSSVPRSEDWQVRAPRAHGVPISLRHHARRLCHVPEVVGYPRRKQLAERDAAKLRVLTLEGEFALGEIPGAERRQVRRAQARELVQQIDESLPLTLADLGKAIVRRIVSSARQPSMVFAAQALAASGRRCAPNDRRRGRLRHLPPERHGSVAAQR